MHWYRTVLFATKSIQMKTFWGAKANGISVTNLTVFCNGQACGYGLVWKETVV